MIQMNQEQNCFAKGIYSYPQVSGYLSVKQFMIIEQNAKKCLLLRFFNEADFDITAVEFSVKQIDSQGDVIETTNVQYPRVRIRAGEMYAPGEGVVLKQDCVDIIVQMISLVGGNYQYRFRNGIVTAHYDPRGYDQNNAHRRSYLANEIKIFRRKTEKVKPYRIIAFLAIIVIILSLLHVLYQNEFDKKKQKYDNAHGKTMTATVQTISALSD